jgi:aryl-alcohol dehydrogenase-like predicted oxidoreductase
VPFAPLGRGFLTGTVCRAERYPDSDFRRHDPRLQGENFDANVHIAEAVSALARRRGATAGQVALAWLLAQGDDIVPIPGTKRRTWLEENTAAAALVLTPAELSELDAAAPQGSTAGPRYNATFMALVDR